MSDLAKQLLNIAEWFETAEPDFARTIDILREAASALDTPTPSEQQAPAKPQDEAEMREVLAKAYEKDYPDGDLKWPMSLRLGKTNIAVISKVAFEAMRTYAATERASARREAMEEARTAVRLSACTHEGSSVVDAIARNQLKASVEAIEALMTDHPDAKAEDAPPDPLDRPVRDWRKVRVTAGMLCEAIQIAQNVPSGQIASATRFRRAVEAVATDTLDRSASLHTGER